MTNKNECLSFKEKVLDFIEGSLPMEEFSRFKIHLRECDTCTDLLLSFIEEKTCDISPQTQQLIEALSDTISVANQKVELEPQPDSWRQLQKSIKKETRQSPGFFPFWFYKPAFSLTVFAASLVIIFFNFQWQNRYSTELTVKSMPINHVYYDGLLTVRSNNKSYVLKPGQTNILHIKPYNIRLQEVPFEIREINDRGQLSNISIWSDILRKDKTYEYLEVLIPSEIIDTMKPDRIYGIFYPQSPDSSPQFTFIISPDSMK